MPMREPKKLQDYSEAEDAALGLEQIAAEIRAHAAHRPLVKWYLNLSFWNPEWKTRDYTPPNGVFVSGTSFSNKAES